MYKVTKFILSYKWANSKKGQSNAIKVLRCSVIFSLIKPRIIKIKKLKLHRCKLIKIIINSNLINLYSNK